MFLLWLSGRPARRMEDMVQILAVLLLIQLPANALGKMANAGAGACTPTTHRWQLVGVLVSARPTLDPVEQWMENLSPSLCFSPSQFLLLPASLCFPNKDIACKKSEFGIATNWEIIFPMHLYCIFKIIFNRLFLNVNFPNALGLLLPIHSWQYT